MGDGAGRRIGATGCLAGFLGLLVAGCGTTDGRVPVEGTVIIDGQPAAGVTVWFHAAAETKGNGGYADTDSGGRFTGRTHQGRPGLYPGSYAITLSVGQSAEGVPDGGGRGTSIPGVYTRPETTPFQMTLNGRQGPLELSVAAARK